LKYLIFLYQGRVIAKSDVRKFNSARGEGCFFTADTMDVDGATIRLKAFGDACNKFFDHVQVGSVYKFSRFRVNMANAKFNQGMSSQYEITLDPESQADAQQNTTAIATIPTKDLKKIDELNTIPIPPPAEGQQRSELTVDTIGVVTKVTEASDFTSRAGKQMRSRTISISDSSLMTMDVKFFGDISDAYTTAQLDGAVVLLRGARLSEFNGRNLMMGFNGEMYHNPDIPQARELKAWYEQTGKNASFTATSKASAGGGDFRNPVPISSVLDVDVVNRLAMAGQGASEYATVRGYIHLQPLDGERKPWYDACNKPDTDCKRKVNGAPGNYHCDTCNYGMATCRHIYILNVTVYDNTGSRWISAFGDDGETIIGQPAETLAEAHASGNVDMLRETADAAQYKLFDMRLRFRLDASSLDNAGQPRVRASIVKIAPVDPVADTNAVLTQLTDAGSQALAGLL
jgi:replication factor A1